MSESIEYIKITSELNKKEAKTKKAKNQTGSAKMLTDNKINFEVKNGGIHLIVKHNGYVADFWPSTGKFNIRGDHRYFRGVRLLIKIIRGDYDEQQFKSLQAN